ncbi:alkaline shock response membrane anchor protein AmaP [Amycolatopsis sp. FBCC-B4732]|uniref:alkaline shock response membrane anchor protein AmaP n=1 Tax=Amycolatopsis sp. FBCC-B4732 TaxID=3079339 RepID=UPI001FF2393D|nr:alkaline shock response membrane anchor protein AmaP [Amycolatopsis sp. FBCC-B4732]UOX84691.1 alkaline shock response membrane anchor protein AmaP [Amycolatopsis sp. FBCC-B4732]
MTKSVAAKALSRSYAGERVLTFLVGLLALLGGALALVVGFGVLGEYRGRRPLLDPMAVEWLGSHATPARIAAIVLGVLLFVLGLRWALRSLRPEPRPDLDLDRTDGAELVVTAAAIAEAVQADAEQLDGVSRARVRAVGSRTAPALRITLWLHEGTDLKGVWAGLDTQVLARARESLGLDVLPTAVRLELDTTAPKRVR